VSRTDDLLGDRLGELYRRIDKMFAVLLIVQWVFAIVLALVVSPYTYSGNAPTIHFHVKLAVFFGAVINALPLALFYFRPGSAAGRHSVAVVQILWSAILISITGGRIETHFHVFGSLAFLALYRDWRVIMTATLAVLADHFARGILWPEAVYGIADPQWWRVFEHAGWVAFEDVVLIYGCVHAVRSTRALARNTSDLEALNASIERKVESRTRALSDAKDRFRMLVENIEAVPFEYDVALHEVVYMAPQGDRILRTGDALFANVYPADAQRVHNTLEALGTGSLKAASFDYRVMAADRQLIHLRIVASARAVNRVTGVAFDVTKQSNLELELRQAQKLESVGRLAAGVAHEINTPIQYVNDSVRFLQTAVEDVMVVVGKHRESAQRTVAGSLEQDLARAALAAEDAVDLPFLSQAMPEAIDRAVVGIDRVAAIVRSIKAFAHPDTVEMTTTDLNTAIANTLLVATNEYKYVADVVTEFGDLPVVSCHVGEINQVVLNLIVNAAHAIGERIEGTQQRGTITIATRIVGGDAEIAITDTGNGIPEGIRDRIFDPFFTTKDVGHGTGQGLAIARSVVVDKHHGKLGFVSRVGVGTTFLVTLPIEQQMREAA
jgi:signal transduction histidine kinase